MRTTIDIPDPVYQQLKIRAAKESRPVKTLILLAVEQALKRKRISGQRVTCPIVQSKRPGTLQLDNAKIYEIIGFP